jgi:tetratricopeptide (TPR) repeat protein
VLRSSARAFIIAIGVCVVVALACVQLGSDALYNGRPSHAFGMAVYRALDRVAPSSFVEDTLANEALADGNLDLAQHYAVRMPASQRRDDMLARVALARGQNVLAGEYFFVADDIDELQQRVSALAANNVAVAFDFEARIRGRLIALRTHPDAVADSYWISGNLEVQRDRLRSALQYYRQAEALAPLDVKYVLAVANTALRAGALSDAQAMYVHGTQVAPGSGDMNAGLGLVALRRGDRAAAERDLERARQLNPNAALVAALERALQ